MAYNWPPLLNGRESIAAQPTAGELLHNWRFRVLGATSVGMRTLERNIVHAVNNCGSTVFSRKQVDEQQLDTDICAACLGQLLELGDYHFSEPENVS